MSQPNRQERYNAAIRGQSHHDHGLDHAHGIMAFKTSQKDHDRAALGFDEVSTKLHTDPLFIMAQDDWGAWPQALYNACQRLGWERVRDAIIFTRSKPGIRNRSAYLFKVLKTTG